jgi:TRAP-type C4-dicarboxylate transport system permease small subunit
MQAAANAYRLFMRLVGHLNLALAVVAAAMLFSVTLAIFFEVTWRYIGGRSQLWVTEISEYSLLYITFLAGPYLLQHNRHVTVDLLTAGRTGLAAKALNALIAITGCAVCALVTFKGVDLVLDQYATGLRRITVMAPRSWYIIAAFPLGTGLMAVQFFDHAVTALRTPRGGPLTDQPKVQ